MPHCGEQGLAYTETESVRLWEEVAPAPSSYSGFAACVFLLTNLGILVTMAPWCKLKISSSEEAVNAGQL